MSKQQMPQEPESGLSRIQKIVAIVAAIVTVIVSVTTFFITNRDKLPPPLGTSSKPVAISTETPEPTFTPTPITITSYSTPFPGSCDPNQNSRIQWVLVKGTVTCSSSGTTLTKLQGWNGPANDGYAELRFSIPGQQFPANYSLSVSVSNLHDSMSSPPNACAGLRVHTSSDVLTFDELSICSDGEYVIARHQEGKQNYYKDTHVIPNKNAGTYLLQADISSNEIKLTIDNNAGAKETVMDTPVSTTTAYISTEVTWQYAGAAATFSNFQYNGG